MGGTEFRKNWAPGTKVAQIREGKKSKAGPYFCCMPVVSSWTSWSSLRCIPSFVEFLGADARGHQAGLSTPTARNVEGPMEGLSLPCASQILGFFSAWQSLQEWMRELRAA